jgi:dienelactone hydrolase
MVLAGQEAAGPEKAVASLPGTKALTWKGDIASDLVNAAHRFLVRETEQSVDKRAQYWARDFSSPARYEASIEANRKRLAHILGVRDARGPFDAPELVGTVGEPPLVGQGRHYDILSVRWPAFGDVFGEGLLLRPHRAAPVANVVAIPDVTQTPEQLAGLVPGIAAESQVARRLAESGCQVLVPVLVDRERKTRGEGRGARGEGKGTRDEGRAPRPFPSGPWLTSREFIYRPAFELGRHVIGYEVQKVLAGVDWFSRDAVEKRRGQETRAERSETRAERSAKVGVIGWGEGGLLALYAGALDRRIDAVCVSGYFDDRRNLWQEPVDRNVFGLLREFGDAELASLIAPRVLIVEAARGPEVVLPGQGGAPGRLVSPKLDAVGQELERARQLTAALQPPPALKLVVSGDGQGPCGSPQALGDFLKALGSDGKLADSGPLPVAKRASWDFAARQDRQIHQLDRHTQQLLERSPSERQTFMSKLDTATLDGYRRSAEPYRAYFAREVIGVFDHKLLPPNVRTRKIEESPQWVRYEVVLDVFEEVFSYGILTVPRGIAPGERRPVVVCQHGLEGRPQDVIGKPGYRSYKAFATRLAEEGFVTFAPQNLYLFGDRFRSLQRLANPLKATLFAIMVAQHQQIVNWLKTLPFVDPGRIAFYGLSYGGKSAMRIPPLVGDYCLSICSADFSDWIWKNASTLSPFSYVWTGEYEIFEFDLGNTFNYAEMAALIAPRPFMVERGHFDTVAPDERVALEYAKVRNLYAARLGIGDRTEIEWFVGPHTINGQGTFRFLHKHLNWPGRRP